MLKLSSPTQLNVINYNFSNLSVTKWVLSIWFPNTLYQKVIKISSIVIIALLLGWFAFFWGVKTTFPGNLISNYIEQFVSARYGLTVDLETIELNWNHLYTKEAKIIAPPGFVEDFTPTLFTVKDIKLYLFPLISSFQINLSSNAYDGTLKLKMPVTGKSAEVKISKVKLDSIPVVNMLPFARVRGRISFKGNVNGLDKIRKEVTALPTGIIGLKLENLKINPNIPAIKLSELYFPSIELTSEINKIVNLKKLELKGSVEGSINGNIRPNLRRWINSNIDFNVKLDLSESLRKELGTINSFLKPFQCGDQINTEISGTLRKWMKPETWLNPRQKKHCK